MTLYEQWKEIEKSTSKMSEKEVNAFWTDFFEKEKNVYDSLLTEHNEKVHGKLGDLAGRYNLTPVEMAGFLDGINDSLIEKNPLETMDVDTEISLVYDDELLFRNMIDADAEWLYGLPQWEEILGKEEKHRIFIEQRKSRTVHVKKIGRNEPCPCGSGKKYKFCHGKKGAPPLELG